MKLYSMNLSPFAARTRMAVYAKGLDIEITPPGDTSSPEYLAINGFGKIPCLDTGAERIPESETILEYLEDRFPSPSLRGETPEQTARMRLIARAAELYLTPHMQVLFGQLNPATRDAEKADEALTKAEAGLDHIERLLGDEGYAVGGRLSLADCSVAPMTFFLPMIGGAFGRDLTASRPKLAAYMAKLATDPVWTKVQAEMMTGLQHMQATGRPN